MTNSGRFIGERISVELANLETPSQFCWRTRVFKIVKIEASSRRLDFRRVWYRRRHRDYFIVLVDTGQRFEIYRHRLPGEPYWVLTRELYSTEEPK